MSIKKIKINQLKVGMYMVGLDISWIRSPFLKHSRLIKKPNDIKLLLQAGVKEVSIETDKSQLQVDEIEQNEIEKNKTKQEQEQEQEQEQDQEIVEQEYIDLQQQVKNNHQLGRKESQLSAELDSALLLKQQARESFSNLSESIKNNKSIEIKEVLPIVDESINSLIRNNQALLTLIHMQRSEKELFTHSFSVMSLLLSLAISLKYTDKQLEKLGLAALLHDLGWSKIPLHLLAKNKKYTANEKKVIHQHIAIIVQQLLSTKGSYSDVIELISEHHERGDGSGYPRGLKLNEVSQESSLLALVDHYDELIHGLSDKPGVIPSLALKYIYKETLQGKFHKQQVEQLIALLGIYPLTSAVKLSSNEKGIVAEINRDKPLKPHVKVFYDAKGRPITQPFSIDLNSDEKGREITQLIDLCDQQQDPLNLLVVHEVEIK